MHRLAILLLPALASAATIQVQVGSGGLKFDPESTTAAAGDVLFFNIHPDHNVAQSTFDSPCQPIDNRAIYSGEDAKTFAVTVNDSKPLWFYCATPEHCSEGMVMAVNAPPSMSITQFKANAAKGGDGTAPAAVYGGIVNASPSGSSGSSSGSMSMSMSMNSSMSMSSGSAMMSSVSMSSGMSSMASSTGSPASGSSGSAAGGSSSTPSSGLGSYMTPPPVAAAVMGGIFGLAYLL